MTRTLGPQRRIALLGILIVSFCQLASAFTVSQPYSPETAEIPVEIQDAEFSYDGRTVPLRVYLPEGAEPAPIILLSHGLGGTRESCGYLGKQWAGRGYVVVAMQHAGSDFEVIRSAPRFRKFQTLKDAASAKNAKARYADVKATIDFLERENRDGGRYTGRLETTKIGMSGHSFGAVTTQAVSGQNYSFLGQAHTDQRIDAALALSPSPPTVGRDAGPFAKVSIPWMLMTGTKDDSPIGRAGDAESRLEVFKGLPDSGYFYELLLEGAEHAAFGDHPRLKQRDRNPNHHRAIRSLSTAFWDAYLKEDVAAKEWLNGSGAREVLEPKDRWQRK